MSERTSLFEFFREIEAKLPPPPKFDRVCVHDKRVFASLRCVEPGPLFGAMPPSLVGFPVVIDPEMEVGVVELRNGDEVIDSLLLAELRA